MVNLLLRTFKVLNLWIWIWFHLVICAASPIKVNHLNIVVCLGILRGLNCFMVSLIVKLMFLFTFLVSYGRYIVWFLSVWRLVVIWSQYWNVIYGQLFCWTCHSHRLSQLCLAHRSKLRIFILFSAGARRRLWRYLRRFVLVCQMLLKRYNIQAFCNVGWILLVLYFMRNIVQGLIF